MKSALECTDQIVATEDAVSCDLGSEAVILHLDSGSYFGLDAIGSSIWNYIQQARTFDEIVDHLLTEYDVSRTDCESDVRELLDAMLEQSLVKIKRDENPRHVA